MTSAGTGLAVVFAVGLAGGGGLGIGIGTGVAGPSPGAIAGWDRYVAATEARRRSEIADPDRFLALDFGKNRDADRRALLSGTVVIRLTNTVDGSGRSIDVPSAAVHHWLGAAFIPGADVEATLASLKQGPPRTEDVLEARVLARGDDTMRIFLRLKRSKIVTAVYNTEHDVRFERYGASRAASTTIATRIAELRDPGTPKEVELSPGDDRGFLWRLNAYWRYAEVPGGVIAECESLSLSRGVPFGLGLVITPIADGVARESMERTLVALRRDLARPLLQR